MVAAATVGAAVVGGAISSSASKSAAKTQAGAARDAGAAQAEASKYAADLSYKAGQQARGDLQPYRVSGKAANTLLSTYLGLTSGNRTSGRYGDLLQNFTGKNLAKEPGYQFRLNEGIKGLDRSAASRGGLFSGAAAKALSRFGQDYASNEYTNAFNRDLSNKNRIYQMLSGAVGIGENAAARSGNASTAAASNVGNYVTQGAANVGNYMTQGANAQAAGQIGVGNAISGALNNYQQYNMLNSLLNQGSQNSLTAPTSFSAWGGGTNDYQGYY